MRINPLFAALSLIVATTLALCCCTEQPQPLPAPANARIVDPAPDARIQLEVMGAVKWKAPESTTVEAVPQSAESTTKSTTVAKAKPFPTGDIRNTETPAQTEARIAQNNVDAKLYFAKVAKAKADAEKAAGVKAIKNALRAACLNWAVDRKLAYDVATGVVHDFGNVREKPVCAPDVIDEAFEDMKAAAQ